MLKQLVLLIITIQAILCQHESVHRCARAAGACLLAPEVTEGPYYWNSTVRQDITEGRPGIPFQLSVTILNTNSCTPVADALVDLWHCDAEGIYSHYVAASQGNMRGRNDNSTFFRGQQITDSQGIAVFDTVYPGWYRGRTTHIHIKVHIGSSLTNTNGAIYAKGGHVAHTGQLFFDDQLTDRVARISPYSAISTQRISNNQDGIYREANGQTMHVAINFDDNNLTKGMTGEVTVGVDPTATPASADFGPPPNGGRPPRPPRSTTPRS